MKQREIDWQELSPRVMTMNFWFSVCIKTHRYKYWKHFLNTTQVCDDSRQTYVLIMNDTTKEKKNIIVVEN